jgi:hypothetical protein
MLRLVCHLTDKEDKYADEHDVVEIWGQVSSIWNTWYMYSNTKFNKHLTVYNAAGSKIDMTIGLSNVYSMSYTEERHS